MEHRQQPCPALSVFATFVGRDGRGRGATVVATLAMTTSISDMPTSERPLPWRAPVFLLTVCLQVLGQARGAWGLVAVYTRTPSWMCPKDVAVAGSRPCCCCLSVHTYDEVPRVMSSVTADDAIGPEHCPML